MQTTWPMSCLRSMLQCLEATRLSKASHLSNVAPRAKVAAGCRRSKYSQTLGPGTGDVVSPRHDDMRSRSNRAISQSQLPPPQETSMPAALQCVALELNVFAMVPNYLRMCTITPGWLSGLHECNRYATASTRGTCPPPRKTPQSPSAFASWRPHLWTPSLSVEHLVSSTCLDSPRLFPP